MKTASKPSIACTGFVLLSFLVPSPANSALFSQVYVFGDSLSDTGRLYAITSNPAVSPFPIPVSPPYAQKFSNGPLWVEYLQQSLGLTPNPTTNFALAGSTTGSTNTGSPFLPGVQQQVVGFLTVTPNADPNALYVLWAGSNDYLGGGQTNVAIPVGNLSNYITALYGVGARNFLVPNLSNLGELPSTLPPNSNSAALSQITIAHNNLLASTLGSLSSTLPNSRIIPLDVFSLFTDIVNQPSQYGITNVTQACLPANSGVPTGLPCSNPDEYLFWDDIHPTTRSHQFIGQLASSAVGVPEPSITVGLLTIGVAAVGLSLGKKFK